MTIREIKWLVDENIHNEVVAYLLREELDIVFVKETELRGSVDAELMSWAFKDERGIITHDSDFGTLAFVNDEPFHAILYLRPGHFDPSFTIETIKQLLTEKIDIPIPSIVSVTRKKEELQIRINRVRT